MTCSLKNILSLQYVAYTSRNIGEGEGNFECMPKGFRCPFKALSYVIVSEQWVT